MSWLRFGGSGQYMNEEEWEVLQNELEQEELNIKEYNKARDATMEDYESRDSLHYTEAAHYLKLQADKTGYSDLFDYASDEEVFTYGKSRNLPIIDKVITPEDITWKDANAYMYHNMYRTFAYDEPIGTQVWGNAAMGFLGMTDEAREMNDIKYEEDYKNRFILDYEEKRGKKPGEDVVKLAWADKMDEVARFDRDFLKIIHEAVEFEKEAYKNNPKFAAISEWMSGEGMGDVDGFVKKAYLHIGAVLPSVLATTKEGLKVGLVSGTAAAAGTFVATTAASGGALAFSPVEEAAAFTAWFGRGFWTGSVTGGARLEAGQYYMDEGKRLTQTISLTSQNKDKIMSELMTQWKSNKNGIKNNVEAEFGRKLSDAEYRNLVTDQNFYEKGGVTYYNGLSWEEAAVMMQGGAVAYGAIAGIIETIGVGAWKTARIALPGMNKFVQTSKFSKLSGIKFMTSMTDNMRRYADGFVTPNLRNRVARIGINQSVGALERGTGEALEEVLQGLTQSFIQSAGPKANNLFTQQILSPTKTTQEILDPTFGDVYGGWNQIKNEMIGGFLGGSIVNISQFSEYGAKLMAGGDMMMLEKAGKKRNKGIFVPRRNKETGNIDIILMKTEKVGEEEYTTKFGKKKKRDTLKTEEINLGELQYEDIKTVIPGISSADIKFSFRKKTDAMHISRVLNKHLRMGENKIISYYNQEAFGGKAKVEKTEDGYVVNYYNKDGDIHQAGQTVYDNKKAADKESKAIKKYVKNLEYMFHNFGGNEKLDTDPVIQSYRKTRNSTSPETDTPGNVEPGRGTRSRFRIGFDEFVDDALHKDSNAYESDLQIGEEWEQELDLSDNPNVIIGIVRQLVDSGNQEDTMHIKNRMDKVIENFDYAFGPTSMKPHKDYDSKRKELSELLNSIGAPNEQIAAQIEPKEEITIEPKEEKPIDEILPEEEIEEIRELEEEMPLPDVEEKPKRAPVKTISEWTDTEIEERVDTLKKDLKEIEDDTQREITEESLKLYEKELAKRKKKAPKKEIKKKEVKKEALPDRIKIRKVSKDSYKAVDTKTGTTIATGTTKENTEDSAKNVIAYAKSQGKTLDDIVKGKKAPEEVDGYIKVKKTAAHDLAITPGAQQLDYVENILHPKGRADLFEEGYVWVKVPEKPITVKQYTPKDKEAPEGVKWIPAEEKKAPEFKDELTEEAIDVVRLYKQASVSLLQRKFKIGYSRAGRILDELEELGIIGPYTGVKFREVLPKKKEKRVPEIGLKITPKEEQDLIDKIITKSQMEDVFKMLASNIKLKKGKIKLEFYDDASDPSSGYIQGKTIHINKAKIMTANTMLHEFVHPILDMLYLDNPDLFKSILKEIEKEDPDLRSQILYGYSDEIDKGEMSDLDIDKEIMTHHIEKAGNDRVHDYATMTKARRIWLALKRFFRWLGEKLGFNTTQEMFDEEAGLLNSKTTVGELINIITDFSGKYNITIDESAFETDIIPLLEDNSQNNINIEKSTGESFTVESASYNETNNIINELASYKYELATIKNEDELSKFVNGWNKSIEKNYKLKTKLYRGKKTILSEDFDTRGINVGLLSYERRIRDELSKYIPETVSVMKISLDNIVKSLGIVDTIVRFNYRGAEELLRTPNASINLTEKGKLSLNAFKGFSLKQTELNNLKEFLEHFLSVNKEIKSYNRGELAKEYIAWSNRKTGVKWIPSTLNGPDDYANSLTYSSIFKYHLDIYRESVFRMVFHMGEGYKNFISPATILKEASIRHQFDGIPTGTVGLGWITSINTPDGGSLGHENQSDVVMQYLSGFKALQEVRGNIEDLVTKENQEWPNSLLPAMSSISDKATDIIYKQAKYSNNRYIRGSILAQMNLSVSFKIFDKNDNINYVETDTPPDFIYHSFRVSSILKVYLENLLEKNGYNIKDINWLKSEEIKNLLSNSFVEKKIQVDVTKLMPLTAAEEEQLLGTWQEADFDGHVEHEINALNNRTFNRFPENVLLNDFANILFGYGKSARNIKQRQDALEVFYFIQEELNLAPQEVVTLEVLRIDKFLSSFPDNENSFYKKIERLDTYNQLQAEKSKHIVYSSDWLKGFSFELTETLKFVSKANKLRLQEKIPQAFDVDMYGNKVLNPAKLFKAIFTSTGRYRKLALHINKKGERKPIHPLFKVAQSMRMSLKIYKSQFAQWKKKRDKMNSLLDLYDKDKKTFFKYFEETIKYDINEHLRYSIAGIIDYMDSKSIAVKDIASNNYAIQKLSFQDYIQDQNSYKHAKEAYSVMKNWFKISLLEYIKTKYIQNPNGLIYLNTGNIVHALEGSATPAALYYNKEEAQWRQLADYGISGKFGIDEAALANQVEYYNQLDAETRERLGYPVNMDAEAQAQSLLAQNGTKQKTLFGKNPVLRNLLEQEFIYPLKNIEGLKKGEILNGIGGYVRHMLRIKYKVETLIPKRFIEILISKEKFGEELKNIWDIRESDINELEATYRAQQFVLDYFTNHAANNIVWNALLTHKVKYKNNGTIQRHIIPKTSTQINTFSLPELKPEEELSLIIAKKMFGGNPLNPKNIDIEKELKMAFDIKYANRNNIKIKEIANYRDVLWNKVKPKVLSASAGTWYSELNKLVRNKKYGLSMKLAFPYWSNFPVWQVSVSNPDLLLPPRYKRVLAENKEVKTLVKSDAQIKAKIRRKIINEDFDYDNLSPYDKQVVKEIFEDAWKLLQTAKRRYKADIFLFRKLMLDSIPMELHETYEDWFNIKFASKKENARFVKEISEKSNASNIYKRFRGTYNWLSDDMMEDIIVRVGQDTHDAMTNIVEEGGFTEKEVNKGDLLFLKELNKYITVTELGKIMGMANNLDKYPDFKTWLPAAMKVIRRTSKLVDYQTWAMIKMYARLRSHIKVNGAARIIDGESIAALNDRDNLIAFKRRAWSKEFRTYYTKNVRISKKMHINEATGNQNPQFEKITLIEHAWKNTGEDLDVMFIGSKDSLEQYTLKNADGQTLKNRDGIARTGWKPSYIFFGENKGFTHELDLLSQALYENNMVIAFQRGDSKKIGVVKIKKEHSDKAATVEATKEYWIDEFALSTYRVSLTAERTEQLESMIDTLSLGDIKNRASIIAVHELYKRVFPNYLADEKGASNIMKRLKIPFTPVTISPSLPGQVYARFDPENVKFKFGDNSFSPMVKIKGIDEKKYIGDGMGITSARTMKQYTEHVGLKPNQGHAKTVVYERRESGALAIKWNQMVPKAGFEITDLNGNVLYTVDNKRNIYDADGNFINALLTNDEAKVNDIFEVEGDVITVSGQSVGFIKFSEKVKNNIKHNLQWLNYVPDGPVTQHFLNVLMPRMERNLRKAFLLALQEIRVDKKKGTITGVRKAQDNIYKFLKRFEGTNLEAFSSYILEQAKAGFGFHTTLQRKVDKLVQTQLVQPALNLEDSTGSILDVNVDWTGQLKTKEISLAVHNAQMVKDRIHDMQGRPRERARGGKIQKLSSLNDFLEENPIYARITRSPVTNAGGSFMARVMNLHGRDGNVDMHPYDVFVRIEADNDGDQVHIELLDTQTELVYKDYMDSVEPTAVDLAKYTTGKFYDILNLKDRLTVIDNLVKGQNAVGEIANITTMYGIISKVFNGMIYGDNYVRVREPNEIMKHPNIPGWKGTVAEYLKLWLQAAVDNNEFGLIGEWDYSPKSLFLTLLDF